MSESLSHEHHGAKLLAACRHANGLTIHTLASATGVPSAAIRGLEAGADEAVPASFWINAARELHVPASLLLGDLPHGIVTDTEGLSFYWLQAPRGERTLLSGTGARVDIRNPTLEDVLQAINVHIKPLDPQQQIAALTEKNKLLEEQLARYRRAEQEGPHDDSTA